MHSDRIIIMGKVDINKQNKRTSLLRSAYDLFTDRGFAKTTIADIAQRSGLAKGTFYLYFKDKYDLRDELVIRKSAQLLLDAHNRVQAGPEIPDTLEDYMIALIDQILAVLKNNKMLLRFISKNLSWGFFRKMVKEERRAEYEDLSDFYRLYLEKLRSTPGIHCQEPEILLFMIMELVSSTCYSCILYDTPLPLDAFLPHLHLAVRQILKGYITPSSSRPD